VFVEVEGLGLLLFQDHPPHQVLSVLVQVFWYGAFDVQGYSRDQQTFWAGVAYVCQQLEYTELIGEKAIAKSTNMLYMYEAFMISLCISLLEKKDIFIDYLKHMLLFLNK